MARPSLPPSPREVPLPETFGDWYDTAAVNLGVAEKRDSRGLRLLAGLVLVVLTTIGLGAFAGPQLAALLGYTDEAVDAATLVLGLVLVAGTLAWWFWLRRDWVRARRLRRAWAYALRDRRVLALPAREHRGPGEDPEDRHHYRAREHVELAPYTGVRSVGGVSGFLDFLRAVLYPVVLGAGVLLVVVGLSRDDAGSRFTTALAALPLTLAALGGTVRAWWRLGESWRLVGLENDDRFRWTGWRVLRGIDRPLDVRGPAARRALLLLPVALGALVVVIGRASTGTLGPDDVLVGVAIVAVPALAVVAFFRVRALRARAGGEGFAVRVLPDDVPPQGPTSVPVGPARLVLSDGRASLGGVESEAAALISGAPQMLAARRHVLVLADGSQVRFSCADVAGVRRAAQDAGLRVL
ncbi:hypothetical protein [Isoptericola variabilis]|uniref:Uncharacterized protein n=1 Tax=Isoptericola variabilis (strain 225) TaxID=743718 RepID=F6FQV5_ISOV2|nr:hypothetical protein [Isoptericola variabilis]AEG42920.1 hypothetical protein Isova_0106 [Isoptericola variabilis 225]TWH31831.1 hypothetical protein L600_002000000400 [Isoptericola variabilis J7]